MTGYGVAAGPTARGEMRVELRSLNARGFVLKQRLCPELVGLEPALEDLIRRRIVRGTVTLTIDRPGAPPLPDREILRQLVLQCRALAKDLGLPEELTLRDVLALAASGRVVGPLHGVPDDLFELVDRALDALQQRRLAEGASIAAEMKQQMAACEAAFGRIRQRAPELIAIHRDKLLARVGEVLKAQGIALEPADLVREVALFADRSDVSEELHRIELHLAEVRSTIAQGGEMGRRLEFLLQELLRETNTLGSKSPDVAIAHDVVAMKSCIDKLKEQAANLE